ncbi:MAG: penicillin-binding transpeptidase domain-containing protein [Candidatus Yanofskybacteria bacterium]|nr:penicillin-binding transpeptidase domain-containing protein [Candidatus Yanofskybacteria bacterium]
MSAFRFFHNKRQFRVAREFSEIEPQEVLLDKLARDRESQELGEKRLEVPLSQSILRAVYGTFVLIAILFLGKSFLLQVAAHEEMAAAAARNTLRSIPVFADRGVIYDRYGVQLAFNGASFDLLCDRRDIPASLNIRERLLEILLEISGSHATEIQKVFEEGISPQVVIQKNLTHEQLLLWETRKTEGEGCQVQENIARVYKDGSLFAHLIGYTANISAQEFKDRTDYFVQENIGKMGVERSYQDELRGRHGKIVMEKDSFGNLVQEHGRVDALPGRSIQLWADAGLQRALAESMQTALAKIGVRKGAAVALDPRNGGVLALVSFPSFDSNLFSQPISVNDWNSISQDPDRPLFNRAIAGSGYPSGSVIKPLIGLAALQEGIISANTALETPLSLCVQNIYTGEDECFADWTFHPGRNDVKRSLAESINPFFYKIGGGHKEFQGLGAAKIKEYLELFGWGERTGIDIPNEGGGVLPLLGPNWRLGDTYHLSIGQGPFAVTPLQVATAFAAIANGGTLFEPQVVRTIFDDSLSETQEPKILKEGFLDAENGRVIREGMRQTVINGTATGFLDRIPAAVAVKTGSAQTGRIHADGQEMLHSWIAGFAPYENPEIVLVVIVEDTKVRQPAALEVARDVFQWYFSR